jgi:hypothetical protein
VVRLFVFFNDFLIWLFNDGVSIGTIGCSADDTMIDECGEIRGMRICRENQSTQWNAIPAPFRRPQISRDLIWDWTWTIELNDSIPVNNKLERIWKEAVGPDPDICLERLEKTKEKPHSE